MVIAALLAERLPATPSPTVSTNRNSAVATFSDGSVVAWRADIAVTRYVLDLADLMHRPMLFSLTLRAL